MPAPHHSVFRDWKPFLPPNQQHQSTEGTGSTSDHVHNWLVNFFNDHSHQTKFGNEMSPFKSISASIIQGSAIGPASYVVNGSDLQAVFEGNFLLKYADDTYLIIPAVKVDSRSAELSHITNWAKHNNLKLNLAKSQEIIFVDRKQKEKVSEPI